MDNLKFQSLEKFFKVYIYLGGANMQVCGASFIT